MLNFLPGMKTYLVAIVAILWGVGSMLFPDLGGLPIAENPMEMILVGLGAMGLRKAIN